jgi:hypothetical protein
MLAIKYPDFGLNEKIWCPKENVSYFFHSDRRVAEAIERCWQTPEYARLNQFGVKQKQRRIWEDENLLLRSLQLVNVWSCRAEGYSLYTVVNLITGQETPLDRWLQTVEGMRNKGAAI